jgi:hypothetical protein
VSNFLELPFFDKLWKEARSMDSTEMADMARFAMDSFEKFQKLYEN